jgi:hypothetical protein
VSPDAIAPNHVHVAARDILWSSNRDEEKKKKEHRKWERKGPDRYREGKSEAEQGEVQTWPSQGNI